MIEKMHGAQAFVVFQISNHGHVLKCPVHATANFFFRLTHLRVETGADLSWIALPDSHQDLNKGGILAMAIKIEVGLRLMTGDRRGIIVRTIGLLPLI